MARPGLYEELSKLGLLDKGKAIALSEGSDADKVIPIEKLLHKAGSQFDVTPKRVFGFRNKVVEESGKPPTRSGIAPRTTNDNDNQPKPQTNGGRQKPKPPPGPNKGSFKPGNPGGPGAPLGNENAVKTGERRNPLLHYLSHTDRKIIEESSGKSALEMQKDSVAFWDARLLDMHKRLRRLQIQRKDMLTIESQWVRQEGDGELSGTYRQAKRKRVRLDDQILKLHEAITRTQKSRDAAVAKQFAMEKGMNPEGGAPVNITQQFGRLSGMSDAELEALVNGDS